MARRWAFGVMVGLVALGAAGCTALAPAPTPTPVPLPTSTPVPASAPTQPTPDLGGANSSDVENAFLSNVDDLIAEANDLTATPCDDLKQVTTDNPTLLPSLRGFTATMKRVASTQAVLNTDDVKAALGDLDHTMGALEGALSQCGISQP
jgi:hypothetical protein